MINSYAGWVPLYYYFILIGSLTSLWRKSFRLCRLVDWSVCHIFLKGHFTSMLLSAHLLSTRFPPRRDTFLHVLLHIVPRWRSYIPAGLRTLLRACQKIQNKPLTKIAKTPTTKKWQLNYAKNACELLALSRELHFCTTTGCLKVAFCSRQLSVVGLLRQELFSYLWWAEIKKSKN